MTTVQRITVVINRRKNIFAFEGVWVAATTSDIRAKIAGVAAVANSQLLHGRTGPLLGCVAWTIMTIHLCSTSSTFANAKIQSVAVSRLLT